MSVSRQVATVGVPIDLFRTLHAVYVASDVARSDAFPRSQPRIDPGFPRVVGRERQPFAPVLVDQLPEIPRAVADVDVRLVEVGHTEGGAAGAARDRLRGRRLD